MLFSEGIITIIHCNVMGSKLGPATILSPKPSLFASIMQMSKLSAINKIISHSRIAIRVKIPMAPLKIHRVVSTTPSSCFGSSWKQSQELTTAIFNSGFSLNVG
jgi:hypothetical protein